MWCKYKINKPPKKIANIALIARFIVAIILKSTLKIDFFISLIIIYGVTFIAIALMIIFDNHFEKVIDGDDTKESANKT